MHVDNVGEMNKFEGDHGDNIKRTAAKIIY